MRVSKRLLVFLSLAWIVSLLIVAMSDGVEAVVEYVPRPVPVMVAVPVPVPVPYIPGWIDPVYLEVCNPDVLPADAVCFVGWADK